MVSERYVGSAAEIGALLEAREAAVLPERARHLAFGDVAAAWGMLQDLGVAGVIDAVAGPRPAGQPLSTGTYLVLAALSRLVAPCSKAAFADWRKTTAADRFTRIPASALGCGPGTILDADPRAHRLRCPRCGTESWLTALPLFVVTGASGTETDVILHVAALGRDTAHGAENLSRSPVSRVDREQPGALVNASGSRATVLAVDGERVALGDPVGSAACGPGPAGSRPGTALRLRAR